MFLVFWVAILVLLVVWEKKRRDIGNQRGGVDCLGKGRAVVEDDVIEGMKAEMWRR